MLPAMSTPANDRLSILVAGCTAAFGHRAALALARRGHRVIAGLREPLGRGRNIAAELGAHARADALDLRVVELDVDNDDSVQAAVASARHATYEHLDVLVNTAAYGVFGPLEACPPDQLLALLNTNVVGALRLYRAVLPAMRAQGSGRIVQLTSGLGRAVLPFMAPYAASAWAQECFAEALAMEVAPFGVRVAIVEPSGYRESAGLQKPVGDSERVEAYQSQLIRIAERLQSGGATDDPAEVVDAIVRLVEADEVPLRTPVGAAAKELVTLRRRLDFEEYERAVLARAGLAPDPAD